MLLHANHVARFKLSLSLCCDHVGLELWLKVVCRVRVEVNCQPSSHPGNWTDQKKKNGTMKVNN